MSAFRGEPMKYTVDFKEGCAAGFTIELCEIMPREQRWLHLSQDDNAIVLHYEDAKLLRDWLNSVLERNEHVKCEECGEPVYYVKCSSCHEWGNAD